ncbi:MAG TPA: tetratricopeptide repeat protein, partial [bacterium]|nr:tetratricopeptide repeat protein [bacterium]
GAGRESREALVELARRQEKKGDFQLALDNLALAEDLAKDDVEAAIHIRLKFGEELIGLGKLNEALAHFDETRERLKKLSNSETNVRLKVSTLEHLGAAYIRANSLEKAKASFHAGLTLMEEFPGAEAPKKVIFENYLGRIQYQEGRLPEAEEAFKQAHAKWLDLPEDQRRRVINNDLGEVLMALGKHEEARDFLLKQLELFREIQNEPLQVKAFYNLAETEAALEHQDTAIDYFKRTIDLAKAQKNFDMLLRAYNGIGRIYHLRQDFENSRKYYDRALTIAQKLQDFQSQAGIETNLGIVLASLDRLSEATPHLKVAVRLAESLGKGLYEQYFLASAKLELGDVLRRQKEFEAAQGLVREAEAIAESQEALAPLLFPVKVTLARLHLDRDRRAEAEEIIQALKKRELSSNEQIEITKLENMLAAGPGAGSREPAATAANFEYSRESQRSALFNPLADSDYAKLLQLTRFINAETNLDFVLKSVLQYALELSGAERGLILLLDERERLEVRASINTAVNANLTEISSKVAEQALQSGEIVESDDASQDGRFNEYQSVMILRLRSILCLPIHSRNKTVGVLYLDHRYRPGAFDKSRLPILQAFCDQAGLAIENAKLFEAYEKSQAALKARLEQAEAEAEHYHELLGEGGGKLPTRYAYENIVAKGKAMYEVFKLLDKITETNISVFINGETGTGKE